MIVTSLLMGLTAEKVPLSDAEIRTRAAELGMVESNSLKLTDIQNTSRPGENDYGGTVEPSGEDGKTAGPGSGSGSDSEMNPTQQSAGGPDTEKSSGESGAGAGGDGSSGEAGTASGGDGPSGEAGTAVGGNGTSGESGTAAGGNGTFGEPGTASGGNGASGEPGTASGGNGTFREPGTASGGDGTTGESGPDEAAGTGSQESVTVVIEPGVTSYRICIMLKEAGLVEDADSFDTYLCENEYSRKIKSGTYEIPVGISEEEIAKIITRSR